MLSNLYLILHKVRGEPAFDVGTRLRCPKCGGIGGHNVPDFETGAVSDYEGADCHMCNGQGFWWIIPTSGHRAYPWWSIPLSEISWDHDLIGLSYNGAVYKDIMSDAPLICPDDARDHYTASEPRAPKAVARPQPATQTEDFLV